MIRRWGIRSSQRPTGGTPDNTCVSMWAGGSGEAASRQSQCLPGKSERPKGGAPSDHHRGPWPDRSGTTLRTKTEVLIGGQLDLDNVERREIYLGTGGLHIRDETTIFLHGGH